MLNPKLKKEIRDNFFSTLINDGEKSAYVQITFGSYEELSICKTSLIEAIEQIMILQYHDPDNDKAIRSVMFLTHILIQLDLTDELSNLDELIRD